MCIAMSLRSSWKSSVRATKSDSQFEFDEHADFSAGVDVLADRAFVGGAGGFLLRGGHAALAQDDEGLFHLAFRFLESLEAVAHGGAGFFAEFFYELCIDLFSHRRHP
jgi:hypothetical protein